MEELRELLSRTPAEEAALDALAGDPDARSLEALRQHLRHETPGPSPETTPPKDEA
jgi:hypothetical protein